ncbi:phytanoyl-CoA dioxygenase family protein [Nocardia sp. BMG51109]|uniref:phytanoyl-CoA dioxygenase family protein n=1 Tax=Nocardia sp. BMG51109 TaxID=1056816 RepID=UPI0004656540|nr:phytanoyl-CoA dioxygenase family protein [Nocardia sp. BMG51109]
MIPAASPADVASHVEAFIEQGYRHFQNVYSTEQVAMFHDLYHRAVADWQFSNGTDDDPGAVGGLLERYPREVLPAVAHPMLLGFAEAVMGPFVQLDSAVLNSDAPAGAESHGRPVMWHRDRFGSVPSGTYQRPPSIVFLSYLQTMTDDAGPLRVIPGSHREPRLVPEERLYDPQAGEVLIRAEAGDTVAIHNQLLHSGTRNSGTADRRFFGFIYNLSTLRQEDNFAGPNCRALVSSAQQTHDRRLQRLLGDDPLIFPRQNSGFTEEHHRDWARWNDEDTRYAKEAEDAAATAARVRTRLG